jgi:hypothetical protein
LGKSKREFERKNPQKLNGNKSDTVVNPESESAWVRRTLVSNLINKLNTKKAIHYHVPNTKP